MTIHSAKGLEFENVFLVGMEEGLFPGTQALYAGPQEMEEERRLAYVAITRAKKCLTVTRAATRMLYGSTGRNLPSRFLREIPEELCETHEAEPTVTGYRFESASAYGKYQRRPFGEYGRFDDHFDDFGGESRSRFESKDKIKPVPESRAASYLPGQSVEHKAFGKGMILSVKPIGNDTLLEIAFESVGTKKIMANFANLKTF